MVSHTLADILLDILSAFGSEAFYTVLGIIIPKSVPSQMLIPFLGRQDLSTAVPTKAKFLPELVSSFEIR